MGRSILAKRVGPLFEEDLSCSQTTVLTVKVAKREFIRTVNRILSHIADPVSTANPDDPASLA
jgi:hypothetical protein